MNLTANEQVEQAVMSIEKLIIKAKPGTSTSMKSVPIALFTGDTEGVLRYANLIGMLQLDMDRLFKNNFLRVYDMESLMLAFEVELYYGFADNYRKVTDTLWAFDYPRGIIAFMFRSKQDADVMALKVKSASPKMEEYEKIRKERIERGKKESESKSLFGRVKNFFHDKE